MRAALKVNNIREDLGKVGPVIAQQVEEAMLGYRTNLDTSKAERESEPVRRMLKFERKVREQIDKLREQLNETRQNLRLTPDNIEAIPIQKRFVRSHLTQNYVKVEMISSWRI